MNNNFLSQYQQSLVAEKRYLEFAKRVNEWSIKNKTHILITRVHDSFTIHCKDNATLEKYQKEIEQIFKEVCDDKTV